MGIVKNGTLGIGRKSFGDATYRTSRGRTIAAKRIQENKSNTSMQSDQRKAFGIMGRSAKLLSEWIDKTFDKTKKIIIPLRHPRLLKNDLRNPDQVRIRSSSPR